MSIHFNFSFFKNIWRCHHVKKMKDFYIFNRKAPQISSFLNPLFLHLLSPAALILLLALTCLDLFPPKPAQNESKHLLTELFYSARLMQRPLNFMCLSVILIFLSASIQRCTLFSQAL